MALTPGSRLGSYDVIAQIGVGGMGEVYRATDTNLGRQVAIKVLPDAVSRDPDRLARFDREARTLAALNHPNIAQIHGLEKDGGQTALVMELVEGPTLADRIADGPIPLDEALPIAKQIAEALGAAHDQGIVHRDLKPANVKVRPDGTVKVLDFGLAKALGSDGLGGGSGSMSLAPTITTPAMTQAGLVLGTAAYMAPEQARGQAVDRRADIWAFGAVLYEMLTGARAFDAEDVSLTLAEVLKSEPDFTRLPAGTPAAIRRLLRRCLQKKPADRLHDIADARLEIADAMGAPHADEVSATAAASPAALAPPPFRLPWAVAALLLVALVAVGWYAWSAGQPGDARSLRASIVLPDGLELALSSQVGVPTSLVLSPDGRRLAVIARDAAGEDRVLVRNLDSPTFQTLAGTEGTRSMFWSPDSEQLAFVAGNTLRRITVAGGPPATIAPIGDVFGGGTWGAGDTIIFSTPNADGDYALMQVPAGGGEPRQAFAGVIGAALRPWFLPGGEHVVFTGLSGDETEADLTQGIPIYAVRLGSTEPVRLGVAQSTNVQYAEGHLLFLREGTLMAMPFDAERIETTGEPFPVVENVQSQGSTPPYGLYSVSGEGLLVYRSGASYSGDTRLTWLDREGTPMDTVGSPSSYVSVRLSPDGEQAVAAVGALGESNLHVVDLARGIDTQVTFRPGMEMYPVWSPDGSRLAFGAGAISTANLRLFLKSSDGTGEEVRLDDGDVTSFPDDWVGDRLLFTSVGRGGDIQSLVPGDAGPRRTLLDTEFSEVNPTLSPDGGWLAYVSNETGAPAVYVARVTGDGARGKIRVSAAGRSVMPRWRGDGRELFFYDRDADALMAASFDPANEARPASVAEPLFRFGGRLFAVNDSIYAYDVSADGQRVLAIMVGEEARPVEAPITVISNWTARGSN